MKTIENGIINALHKLGEIDLWNINIQKISHALNHGLGGSGYAVFSHKNKKSNLEHYEGISKRVLLQKIKRVKDPLAFNFMIDSNAYKILIFIKNNIHFSKGQRACVQNLLSIISKAISMRQVSKNRIIETQIINQLNLNVITTLDENKIIKDLESAARKMLATQNIVLFYIMDDNLIGSKQILKISDVPKNIYNRLFRIQHIFTTKRKHPFFLNETSSSKDNKKTTFIPFTIKNELRGFFVIYDGILKTKRTFTITRLKFLSNQAALALERIDLFRALNRAIRESQGLQELIKIMLSSLDISSLFHEILQRAQKLLGFKRILFSLYNPQIKCFSRITGVGISAKKMKEAKSVHPPLEVIGELCHNRYRISNSYYIPAKAAAKISKKTRKYELYKFPRQKERIGNLWDPGDIFLSQIYSKNRKLVALLSLDKPISKLVPTIEKVKLLETFGDFLGLVIENAQLFEEIEKLSHTDEMTGVYNYRFLREKIKLLIKENVSPISLIMIDLDNFKKYNDEFGHLYGDEILRLFSQNIVNLVNKYGYVIRYGGDEFIILLPKVNLTFNKVLVKKITNYISKHKIIKGRLPIKFSYGLAVYPDNGMNLGDLIDYADKLLYQKKSKKYNESKK